MHHEGPIHVDLVEHSRSQDRSQDRKAAQRAVLNHRVQLGLEMKLLDEPAVAVAQPGGLETAAPLGSQMKSVTGTLEA